MSAARPGTTGPSTEPQPAARPSTGRTSDRRTVDWYRRRQPGRRPKHHQPAAPPTARPGDRTTPAATQPNRSTAKPRTAVRRTSTTAPPTASGGTADRPNGRTVRRWSRTLGPMRSLALIPLVLRPCRRAAAERHSRREWTHRRDLHPLTELRCCGVVSRETSPDPWARDWPGKVGTWPGTFEAEDPGPTTDGSRSALSRSA